MGSRQNTEQPNENEPAIVIRIRTELEEICEEDLTPAQRLISQKRRQRPAQDVTVAMPGDGEPLSIRIRKEFGEYEAMTDMGHTKDILA